MPYINNGYRYVRVPGHPRATYRGYVREHLVVAEAALGRYLLLSERVHHFNRVRSDNANQNLVICENEQYHKLLHQRQRIFEAGGDPATQKFCGKCKELKTLECFYRLKARPHRFDTHRSRCISCEREIDSGSEWRRARKAKAVIV